MKKQYVHNVNLIIMIIFNKNNLNNLNNNNNNNNKLKINFLTNNKLIMNNDEFIK